jgi:hemerythrin
MKQELYVTRSEKAYVAGSPSIHWGEDVTIYVAIWIEASGGAIMVKVKWDKSLSVGIKLIDEQHKMLIQRLNDLEDACSKDVDAQKVMKTLNFLIEYTDLHFSTEEKHMTSLKYPGLKDHRKKHGEFRAVLDGLLDDFNEEGGTQPLVESIDRFMVNWLVEHIKGTDVEFGRFLKKKGKQDIE